VEVPLAFEVEVLRLVDDAETFGVDRCVENEVPLDSELDLDDAETFDVVVCLEEDELERGVDALDEAELFVDVLLVLLVVVLVIDDELLVFETLKDFDVDGLIWEDVEILSVLEEAVLVLLLIVAIVAVSTTHENVIPFRTNISFVSEHPIHSKPPVFWQAPASLPTNPLGQSQHPQV